MANKRKPWQLSEQTDKAIRLYFKSKDTELPTQDQMISELLQSIKPLNERIGVKFDEIAFESREALTTEEQRIYEFMKAISVKYHALPYKRGLIMIQLEKILQGEVKP